MSKPCCHEDRPYKIAALLFSIAAIGFAIDHLTNIQIFALPQIIGALLAVSAVFAIQGK